MKKSKKKKSIRKIIILTLLLASLLTGLFFVVRNDFSFSDGPGILRPSDPNGPGTEQPGDEDDEKPGDEDDERPGDKDDEKPGDKEKQHITSVWLVSSTYEYDGEVKSLSLNKSIPSDAEIEFFNNEQLEIGVHHVIAKITGDNYYDHTLTGTLTITDPSIYDPSKLNFDARFVSKEFVYDGEAKSLEVDVISLLPENASITYKNNNQAEIGNYQVRAVLEAEGYNTLIMTANLRIMPKQFENSLNSKTFVYDGEAKSLELSGEIAEGVSVEWENNEQTEVGIYNVKAVLTAENYETKTLTATLIIQAPAKLNFEGITLDAKEFEYDGELKSLELTGELPFGVDVEWTNNGQTEVGTYTVRAVLSGDNYNTLQLSAALKIYDKDSDSESSATTHDVNIYALNFESEFVKIISENLEEHNIFEIDFTEIKTSIETMLHVHNPYLSVIRIDVYTDIQLENRIDVLDVLVNKDKNFYVKYQTEYQEPDVLHEVSFSPVEFIEFETFNFVLGDGQSLTGYENITDLIKNEISNQLEMNIESIVLYSDKSATEIYNINQPITAAAEIFVDASIVPKQEYSENFIKITGNFNTIGSNIGERRIFHPRLIKLYEIVENGYSSAEALDFANRFELMKGIPVVVYYDELTNQTTFTELIYNHFNKISLSIDNLLFQNRHLFRFKDARLNYYSLGTPTDYDIRISVFFKGNRQPYHANGYSNVLSYMNSYGREIESIDVRYYNNRIDIDRLTFEDAEFRYDGTEKSIEVHSNYLPMEGLTIDYYNNNQTDYGYYQVIASIYYNGSLQGYLEAGLTITPPENSVDINISIDLNGVHGGEQHQEYFAPYIFETGVHNPDGAGIRFLLRDGTMSFIVAPLIEQDESNRNYYVKSLGIISPPANLGNYTIELYDESNNVINSIDVNPEPMWTNTIEISDEYIGLDRIVITFYPRPFNAENFVFEDVEFEYDGTEKTHPGVQLVDGYNLPSGTTITYENNNQAEIGRYTVKATISGHGYEDLTLTARLEIIAYRDVNLIIPDGVVVDMFIYGGYSFYIDGVLIQPTRVPPGNFPQSIYTIDEAGEYLLEMAYHEDLELDITALPGYIIDSVNNTLDFSLINHPQHEQQHEGGTQIKQVHSFIALNAIRPEHVDTITIESAAFHRPFYKFIELSNLPKLDLWQHEERAFFGGAYELDIDTLTATPIQWSGGIDSIYGHDVWESNGRVFYNNGSHQYELDIDTLTATPIQWRRVSGSTVSNVEFKGERVWKYKNRVFSYDGYELHVENLLVSYMLWDSELGDGALPLPFGYIGEQIAFGNTTMPNGWFYLGYFPDFIEFDPGHVHLENIVFEYDGKVHALDPKTEPGLGAAIFVVNNSKIEVGEYEVIINLANARFDKDLLMIKTLTIIPEIEPEPLTATPIQWSGIDSFSGQYVWESNGRVFYSTNLEQYELDIDTLTATPIQWSGGIGSFSGLSVWESNGRVFYSNSSQQYELDIDTLTATPIQWSGIDSFIFGSSVWESDGRVFYSNGSEQYELDIDTLTATPIQWSGVPADFAFSADKYLWKQKGRVFVRAVFNYSGHYYELDVDTLTATPIQWSGVKLSLTWINSWESNGRIFVLQNRNRSIYELTVDTTITVERKIQWSGINSFDNDHVWESDGRMFYSNGSEQYELFIN